MLWVPWIRGYRRRICGLVCKKWGVIALVIIIMIISPVFMFPLLERQRALVSPAILYMAGIPITIGAVVYMYFTHAVPPMRSLSQDQVSPITRAMIEWVKHRAGLAREVKVLRSPGPMNMGVYDRFSSCTFIIQGPLERMLSLEELEAVIAHEFAHVKARDAPMAIVMSIPAMFHVWLALHALFSLNVVGCWAASLLACICFALAAWFKRLTEHLADLGALQILGPERHEDMTTALMKIEAMNILAVRDVDDLKRRTIWSSHPSMEDRLTMLAPR